MIEPSVPEFSPSPSSNVRMTRFFHGLGQKTGKQLTSKREASAQRRQRPFVQTASSDRRRSRKQPFEGSANKVGVSIEGETVPYAGLLSNGRLAGVGGDHVLFG